MEVAEEGDYIPIATMSPPLIWAAMRAIFMFHDCDEQSHKTVSTDHNFSRERRAETVSNRGPPAYQSNALPLGQTGSPKYCLFVYRFYMVLFSALEQTRCARM